MTLRERGGLFGRYVKGKKGGVLSFNDLKTFCAESAVPCGGDGNEKVDFGGGLCGRRKGCETG